ncbi:MAG: hypothetical protein RQ930_04045 [Candidatus Aenigmarchaeota archaeon]|jgi:hypothetical protein|nr:hypothetical protein [Candidatus Aenigmarchaeota archaeon]
MLSAIRYLVSRVQLLDGKIGASWYPENRQLTFYRNNVIIGTYTFESSEDVFQRLPIIVDEIKRRLVVIKAPSLAYHLEKTWQRTRFKPGFKHGIEINGQ